MPTKRMFTKHYQKKSRLSIQTQNNSLFYKVIGRYIYLKRLRFLCFIDQPKRIVG